jgi:CheY-like chemotaxis protein
MVYCAPTVSCRSQWIYGDQWGPQARGRVVQVLVVNPRDRERARVAAGLRQDGYTVRTARSIGQALNLLARDRFDLILSDSFLQEAPGAGEDVLGALLSAAGGARIIITTTEAPADARPRGQRRGGGERARPGADQADLAHLRAQVRIALGR